MKQESGGLLFLRRITPLERRDAVYFCSGAYTHHVHILEMNGESYRLKQSKRKRGSPLNS